MVKPATSAATPEPDDGASAEPLPRDARAVLDALPDPTFATNRAWRFLYCNPAAERVWGRPEAEMVGRALGELFPPFEGSAAQEAMQRALDTQQPLCVEVLSRSLALPLELNAIPMPWGLTVHFRDITGRRQMQSRLQERDDLLTLAEDSAGIGVWEIDVASDTVRGTPQFFRIMGLPPTDDPVPMQRIRSMRLPADGERMLAEYRQMLDNGSGNETEYRLRRPDGEERWVFGRGRLIRDANGKPVRYSGIDVDVTDRKRAEAALRESEDRFRRVFEQSPLGKATLGPDFRLREVNPALCRMVGYTEAELIGRNLLDIVHPDNRATCFAQGKALLDGTMSQVKLEERFVRKSGEAFWVSVNVGPIRNADGAVLYSLGIIEDIDERRRIRHALQESERRLRELNEQLARQAEERTRQLASSRAQLQAFFDNSPDWLTLQRVLPNGRIEYADINPTAEIAYGQSREQVIGRTVEEVLGKDQAQRPLHLLRECVRTGQPQHYVARRTMAGRTFSIDVVFVLVPGPPDAEERFIITTARDLTEREQLEAQLRQAQKMEAVGQLTGGVAHDFNNLLAVIMGSAELARRRGENVGRLLDNILRAGERGVALTRQLLSFSRHQPADPQVIDLRVELPRIAGMLRASLRGDIALKTAVMDDLWSIEVDPGELEIALLNIAVNARDAMPDGGTFSIAVRNADGHVVIAAQDTGSGIPAELLGKVFDPFFTTKGPAAGTGLGLSQVYGFARQSGGRVEIDSQLGAGTTITLYLPRCERQPPEARRPPAASELSIAGRRVLLAEDNPEVAQVTEQMLQSMGCSVVAVHRAQAALDCLARQDFDLLLTDVVMPDGMNGLELARSVRARFGNLPILLLSGYNDVVSGAPPEFRLLCKPVPYAELREAIATCLTPPPAGAAAGAPQEMRAE